MIYRSRDKGTFLKIFKIQAPKKKKKKKKKNEIRNFGGTSSCLRSIQLLERSVHSKSILAFILRSQPRYTSGGSRDMENHAILSLQCPKKQKKNLGHFRLSEWYAYRRLPTVN